VLAKFEGVLSLQTHGFSPGPPRAPVTDTPLGWRFLQFFSGAWSAPPRLSSMSGFRAARDDRDWACSRRASMRIRFSEERKSLRAVCGEPTAGLSVKFATKTPPRVVHSGLMPAATDSIAMCWGRRCVEPVSARRNRLGSHRRTPNAANTTGLAGVGGSPGPVVLFVLRAAGARPQT